MKTFREQIEALRKQGKRAPYLLEREDGGKTLLGDEIIADFLADDLPSPNEAALDQAFAGAVRVRLLGTLASSVISEVQDESQLREVREALRIRPAEESGHFMHIGGLTLEIVGPDGAAARIELLCRADYIRWNGRWNSDAELKDPERMHRWLATQGVPLPSDETE